MLMRISVRGLSDFLLSGVNYVRYNADAMNFVNSNFKVLFSSVVYLGT